MKKTQADCKAWKKKNGAFGHPGEPLFSQFCYEDWQLLSIRVELHLLTHSFPHVPQSDLSHYYGICFEKDLRCSRFGVSSITELATMIHDTLTMEGDTLQAFIAARLDADTAFQHFVELTEAQRREWRKRFDSGDLSAILRFTM